MIALYYIIRCRSSAASPNPKGFLHETAEAWRFPRPMNLKEVLQVSGRVRVE